MSSVRRAVASIRRAALLACLIGVGCLVQPDALRADWAGFGSYAALVQLSADADEISLNVRLSESGLKRLAEPPGDRASTPDPRPWADRIVEVRAENGTRLNGTLARFEKIPAQNAGTAKEAYYEADVRYASQSVPRSLSVVPAAGTNGAIGFVAMHRGIPVGDLAPLNAAARLILNWDDPWRSRIDDPAFARRHTEPRSYLYIEESEVRHELLIPFSNLRRAIGEQTAKSRIVEENERAALAEKLGAYLASRNPLRIDGVEVRPRLEKLEFVRYDRSGIQPVASRDRLDASTALIGAMLAYPVVQPPTELELRWESFGASDVRRMVSVIRGKETFDSDVTPERPVFKWSRDDAFDAPIESATAVPEPDKNAAASPDAKDGMAWKPYVALAVVLLSTLPLPFPYRRNWVWLGVCLAAGLAIVYSRPSREAPIQASGLNEERAKATLAPLLLEAYRAFPLRGEEAAYDRLASCLDGELLDEIYFQQRQALARRDIGQGGEGRVERVEILEIKVAPEGDTLEARWTAHGEVSHWGHSHERHHSYRARLHLAPGTDGRWRIVRLEFLDGQRLADA